MEIPRKEKAEKFYFFAWDHSGAMREVTEDQAITDGYRRYCRILLDTGTLRYRLFVPKTAGRHLRNVYFRKMTQWIRDRFDLRVSDNTRGRLANVNVNSDGLYIDGNTEKAKQVILPKTPGPRGGWH